MLLMCPTLTLTLNPKPRLPWSSAGSQSGASQRMQDQAEVVAIITKVRNVFRTRLVLVRAACPKTSVGVCVSSLRRASSARGSRVPAELSDIQSRSLMGHISGAPAANCWV